MLQRVLFCIGCLYFTTCQLVESSETRKLKAQQAYNEGEQYAKEIIVLFNAGKLDQVAKKFDDVCSKSKLTPVQKLMGYTFVFHSFVRKNDYDSALIYQDACINIIEQNRLENMLPNQYISYLLYKSASLYYLHRPEQANELFFRVKKMNDVNEDLNDKSGIANQLAFISYRQKNYKEALQGFSEVLRLHYTLLPTNYYAETELISNVGLCYFHLKMYDSALHFFSKAIGVLNKHQNKLAPYITTKEGNEIVYKHSKGVVLGNIANVYTNLKQWDSVIVYSLPSIAYNTDLSGERRDAQKVSSRLIDAYIALQKWKDAEQFLQNVQRTLDSLPDAKVRMQWYLQKATLFEAKGSFGNALPYYKQYTLIKDSLQKIELADAESDLVKDLQIRNQESDLSILKKDGELNKLYLYITASLVVIAVVIIGFVFYTHRKTKRTNQKLFLLNNEINKQKTALDKSNKDKDRILRVVAHDLRNPISGIAALSKTLSEQENANPYLKMIEQTSQQTLYLVNELLQNNMDTEALQLKEVAVNTTVVNAVELIQQTAQQKGITIIANEEKFDVKAMLDVAKIERVWHNLLTNAVKFSGANSSIVVSSTQSSTMVTIAVKDNGIGIPIGMQETLFSKVSTARRRGTAGEKSFGLGLSICKEIVEAHGGKIWVESEENKGSTFFVQLPIVH
jgi:signal transduction histidine kinase